MATTYNFTDGSIAGQPVMTQTTLRENETTILRHIIDTTVQALDASETDVAQCLIIPASTTVLTAWIRPITVESTASCVVDLGVTGGNTDAFCDGVSLSTGSVVVGGLWEPTLFASAGTIDLLMTSTVDADTAVFEVCALCVKHVDKY